MLSFLESSVAVDASGKSFGGADTVTANLTLDRRSSQAITSFTVAVPANGDSSVPYTATLTQISGYDYLLTIALDNPLANVHINEKRTLVITSNTSETFDLICEINFADPFILSNWSNSAEDVVLTNIDNQSPDTTQTFNKRIRGLLRSAITGLNKAKYTIDRYKFRRNLPDIIEFAISTGCLQLPSSAAITLTADGDIATCTTTYTSADRGVSQLILITYTYAPQTIKRLIKRSGNYQEVSTESINLLDTITVDALDGSSNIIYRIGTVTLNRVETIVPIPYLLDYNDTLPPETINTDPDNIISDYKYYKTFTITGWTVVA